MSKGGGRKEGFLGRVQFSYASAHREIVKSLKSLGNRKSMTFLKGKLNVR